MTRKIDRSTLTESKSQSQ